MSWPPAEQDNNKNGGTIYTMKNLLSKLSALVYPPTKRKLHQLVSFVGTAFAAFGIFEVWYATLGLSTAGKIGATLGMLATYATSWNAIRPKIDLTIDGLPIPEGSTVTQTETATETKTTTVAPAGAAIPTQDPDPTPATTPIRAAIDRTK